MIFSSSNEGTKYVNHFVKTLFMHSLRAATRIFAFQTERNDVLRNGIYKRNKSSRQCEMGVFNFDCTFRNVFQVNRIRMFWHEAKVSLDKILVSFTWLKDRFKRHQNELFKNGQLFSNWMRPLLWCKQLNLPIFLFWCIVC